MQKTRDLVGAEDIPRSKMMDVSKLSSPVEEVLGVSTRQCQGLGNGTQ